VALQCLLKVAKSRQHSHSNHRNLMKQEVKMTLPLKKAVDSLFNRCGTIGNYQGREVLFLLIEPDEVVGVGFVKAHTDTHFMKIRISDAPDLAVADSRPNS